MPVLKSSPCSDMATEKTRGRTAVPTDLSRDDRATRKTRDSTALLANPTRDGGTARRTGGSAKVLANSSRPSLAVPLPTSSFFRKRKAFENLAAIAHFAREHDLFF